MTHLLDTNICSAYLKRPGGLAHRFLQHVGGLAIPTIVLAELYTWAFRRPQPEPLLRLIEDDLIPDVQVLDFDTTCARRFGELRASLLAGGVVETEEAAAERIRAARQRVFETLSHRYDDGTPGDAENHGEHQP